MDVDRITPSSFVGEVVMKQEMTPFLRAAQAKGCAIQIGRRQMPVIHIAGFDNVIVNADHHHIIHVHGRFPLHSHRLRRRNGVTGCHGRPHGSYSHRLPPKLLDISINFFE